MAGLTHHHQLFIEPQPAAVVASYAKLVGGAGRATSWEFKHSDPTGRKLICSGKPHVRQLQLPAVESRLQKHRHKVEQLKYLSLPM